MGFGSYDESERRDPDYDAGGSDEEDVALHENDYEGTASFESGAPTDDLVAGLASIKEGAEEKEE